MTEGRQDGIITIYYGLNIEDSSIQKTVDVLTQKYENYDIEYYFGGQSYIIILFP
jgi:dihydroxyacetone kinase-like predicted kinase